MSLKGLHLEPLATDSAEFVQYQDVFGGPKLVKLYQITYEPTGLHNLEIFNSYPSLFFHGTGHCGCLARRNVVADSTKINSNDWCGRSGCATQGILNYGHMRTYSYSGRLRCVRSMYLGFEFLGLKGAAS
ncbi:hypothetical protein BGX29_008659 [Mortierella sp. GBA35]|nr:hypothetical protein BGX23_008987 [Mortierella sp. AD031]KAF9096256.1 hypothetical protein BGX29_008659 [Mortierella sp. GBA35]KAG0203713.1 hypothetical protein BGX33_008937 [Mortierella sp. NVP41]